MKYIMLLLLSVSVSVMAQDNTMVINSPREGVTFTPIGPDVGRGPDGFIITRTWTRQGVGSVSAIQGPNGFLGLPSAIFDLANSGAAVPADLADVTAVLGAPLVNATEPLLTLVPFFVKYAPPPGFVGNDVQVITYTINGAPYATTTVTFTVANLPPTIAVTVSPNIALAGSVVSFNAITSDPDGHAPTVSYDYGDGSSGINATHAYAAPGTYTVTATADDGFGGKASAQTVVTVVGSDHLPKARFTTSDIVAFVGVPFVLDGITSTDEQNSIVSYSWNFGDNTVLGSVATLSHIYKSVGLVTVTLTVTDAEGFSSTVFREVEVLSEQAAATFDSEIRVTSTFYPLKQNRDILTVFARVNVGDTTLGAGSAVALEYGGKRFATTLDKRGKASGWVVKQNLRRQTPGTVEITFKARNTAVAESLTTAGAVDGGTVDVPFLLELGPKTILVDVPTDFELSAARGKAAGELD